MEKINFPNKVKASQKEKVLNYLNNNNTITQKYAERIFGIMRLAAVVYALKKDGIKIYRKLSEKTGCATYSLRPFAPKKRPAKKKNRQTKS